MILTENTLGKIDALLENVASVGALHRGLAGDRLRTISRELKAPNMKQPQSVLDARSSMRNKAAASVAASVKNGMPIQYGK